MQEVPSSNLGSPTKFLKELRTRDPPQAAFWSPTGVQNGRRGGHVRAPAVPTVFRSPNSPELSTPRKTRQTRQFASNSLITRIKCVSGGSKNPTRKPTYCPRKPDKSPARPGCCVLRPPTGAVQSGLDVTPRAGSWTPCRFLPVLFTPSTGPWQAQTESLVPPLHVGGWTVQVTGARTYQDRSGGPLFGGGGAGHFGGSATNRQLGCRGRRATDQPESQASRNVRSGTLQNLGWLNGRADLLTMQPLATSTGFCLTAARPHACDNGRVFLLTFLVCPTS